MSELSHNPFPAVRGYTLRRELGAGAAGVVYEARADGDDATPLAIKVLHAHLATDEQLRGRFEREAQILATLRGPSICPVIATGTTEGKALPYMVMPKLEGDKLSVLPPLALPTAEAVLIVQHVCRALETAHGAGVIHRDLKPDNVVISGHQVTVVDFGMAKIVQGAGRSQGSELTATGMIFGTAAYMAPEQARGEAVDARCDIYAAGVILYELLSGKVPFAAGNDVLTLVRVSREPVPELVTAREDVGPALRDAVMRAVAHKPDQRFTSARAFRKALQLAFDRGELRLPRAKQSASAALQTSAVPALSEASAAQALEAAVVLPPAPLPSTARVAELAPASERAVLPPAPLPSTASGVEEPMASTASSAVLAAVVPPAPLPSTQRMQDAPESTRAQPTTVPVPALQQLPPQAALVASDVHRTAPSFGVPPLEQPSTPRVEVLAGAPSSRPRQPSSPSLAPLSGSPVSQHTPAYLRAERKGNTEALRRSPRQALFLLWTLLALLAVLSGIYLALRRTAG